MHAIHTLRSLIRRHHFQRGFTLLELLVVISIIVVLVGILMPVLGSVIDEGRKGACISNLRQIGVGIAAYAGDNDGRIPYGPKGGVFNNAANFYPSTGAPTSLISLQDGSPVGLGLLLDKYLARTPRVLFCPGIDQTLNADKELSKVGQQQAQCSYYYRHGGNTSLMDDPRSPTPEPPLRLADLGPNRNGVPIRALVADVIFLAPSQMQSFGVSTSTNHHQKYANVLFTDGHVTSHTNRNKHYTVDSQDVAQIRASFSKILDVFEYADTEP